MAKKKQRSYQQDVVGDSINSIQKVVKPSEEGGSRIVKYLLIGLSVLFLFVMLALPLAVVAANAWKEGWEAYRKAVMDEYTIKALLCSLPFWQR